VSAAFQPVMTLLAGPNGSGKTTLHEWLNPPGEQINADKIARLIDRSHPENAAGAAGRATLLRLVELIDARQNFSYETTLAGNQPLLLMKRAKASGYRIDLVYVTLKDVKLNLLRVRQRVLEGGHHIPDADIIRRYDRSLAHLSQAIMLADEVAVFDNTDQITELLFQSRSGVATMNALDLAIPHHRALAAALKLSQ
jgi:predicted ABC-type ATPase